MNTDFLKGVIVPIITPIDENELIDEKALREQVDYVIEGGVHGILAFGSNGEFYMIEEDEMERGLKIMSDQAAGRVPVYFGIGAISTKKCVRLARMAAANKAAGISVLQPMFLKPTEAELFGHFKAIADAVPDTLLYASLCHGAVGGVCTAGNFMPELITDIYNKYAAGDLEGSLEAQFKLNPVRLSMDGAGFPVAAKDMANLRGRNVGLPYTPNLPTPEGPVLDQIKAEMKQAGLL